MAKYGLFTLRVDGRDLSIRGDVTENPASISSEAIVNHDGSVDASLTRTGHRLSLTLAARDVQGNEVDVGALLRRPAGPITFIAEGENVITTYSAALITGDPQVDRMTGALSGLSVTAAGRQVTPISA